MHPLLMLLATIPTQTSPEVDVLEIPEERVCSDAGWCMTWPTPLAASRYVVGHELLVAANDAGWVGLWRRGEWRGFAQSTVRPIEEVRVAVVDAQTMVQAINRDGCEALRFRDDVLTDRGACGRRIDAPAAEQVFDIAHPKPLRPAVRPPEPWRFASGRTRLTDRTGTRLAQIEDAGFAQSFYDYLTDRSRVVWLTRQRRVLRLERDPTTHESRSTIFTPPGDYDVHAVLRGDPRDPFVFHTHTGRDRVLHFDGTEFTRVIWKLKWPWEHGTHWYEGENCHPCLLVYDELNARGPNGWRRSKFPDARKEPPRSLAVSAQGRGEAGAGAPRVRSSERCRPANVPRHVRSAAGLDAAPCFTRLSSGLQLAVAPRGAVWRLGRFTRFEAWPTVLTKKPALAPDVRIHESRTGLYVQRGSTVLRKDWRSIAPGLWGDAAAGGCVRVVRVAANDVLNLREGPSHRAPVVETLPPGARARLAYGLDRDVGLRWLPVFRGAERDAPVWAHRKYLETVRCTEPAPP
ncbi:MAG: SH3 domain-containing protein [Deltaproteobacteria bacterium]